jgi:hypothetical protein
VNPLERTKVVEHNTKQICPSARCEEGAVLLGVIGPDGVVGYVTPQLTVDDDFVRHVRRGRTPEARFRFAQPCIEKKCMQWTGCRCGLIDKLLNSPAVAEIVGHSRGPLPKCAIRPTCRWFAQAAAKACAVCPLIVHSQDGTALPSSSP